MTAQMGPAEVTEEPTVIVQRGRLTLETFRAIYAVAHQAAEWLPHAMMLALVSGQDRSTVAAMERKHAHDGHLTTWCTKTRGTNQPEFWNWWIVSETTGKRVRSRWKRRQRRQPATRALSA